jgi:hypothetical protein
MSFIKLDSSQAGPFTSNFNIVDFDIPQGNYDFSQSYVNIMTEINDSNAAEFGEVFLANSVDTKIGVYSSSLVENVSLDTELMGNIENIRKVNVLTQNLKEYTLSIADKKALGSQDICGSVDSRSYFTSSICRRINRQGNVASVAIESPIRVDLKDVLLGVGNMASFPADRLGKTRLHLELQTTLVTPLYVPHQSYQTFSTEALAAGATNLVIKQGADNPNVFNFIEPPFFVGMQISIAGAGAAGANLVTSITSINWDTTQVAWILGIKDAVVTAKAAKTAVVPKTHTSGTLSIVFNRCELVLKKLNQPSNVSKLTYKTFTTEESGGFSAGNYEKLFYLEPNCVNLMIMSPGTSRDSILSQQHYSSYRLRVDNEDLVTRDIPITNKGDALHFDRIKSTLVNAGYNLNNLEQANYSSGLDGGTTFTKNNVETIMTPLSLTENEKQLQLNLVAASAVPRLILYKQVTKSV